MCRWTILIGHFVLCRFVWRFDWLFVCEDSDGQMNLITNVGAFSWRTHVTIIFRWALTQNSKSIGHSCHLFVDNYLNDAWRLWRNRISFDRSQVLFYHWDVLFPYRAHAQRSLCCRLIKSTRFWAACKMTLRWTAMALLSANSLFVSFYMIMSYHICDTDNLSLVLSCLTSFVFPRCPFCDFSH